MTVKHLLFASYMQREKKKNVLTDQFKKTDTGLKFTLKAERGIKEREREKKEAHVRFFHFTECYSATQTQCFIEREVLCGSKFKFLSVAS